MKICRKCKIEKEIEDFYSGSKCKKCVGESVKAYRELNLDKAKERVNNYRKKNKETAAEYNKKWREDNKEYKKQKDREYQLANADKVKENLKKWREENSDRYKQNLKKWREENKEYKKEKDREYQILNRDRRNERHSERLKEDVVYRTGCIAGSLIKASFKRNGFTKRSKTFEILGCSYEDFKIHLESRFQDWMNWDNRGLYNKNKFNYGWDIDHIIPISSAKTEEDAIRLNHYSNLQPLCSKVNRDVKKYKLNYES